MGRALAGRPAHRLPGTLDEASPARKRLQAEGLFAPERKRAIPKFPRRVGIVTSPTGAALRDVLHVLERRGAAFELVLAPSRVQGDGAAAEVAQAIRDLSRWSAERAPVDVIWSTPSVEAAGGGGGGGGAPVA